MEREIASPAKPVRAPHGSGIALVLALSAGCYALLALLIL